MNDTKSIPIGIISVLWDYEDEQLIRDAFYEFSIYKKDEKTEFINKYYFLENNICTKIETTSTYRCNINILELSDKMKIEFCSDLMFLTKEQYQLLNSFITNLQSIYNFEIKTNDIEKQYK
jgi:hypothetical protein